MPNASASSNAATRSSPRSIAPPAPPKSLARICCWQSAVGRIPTISDLDKAGVRCDERGYIVVDDRLQTTAPGIWALGDCNGKGAFTHTAYNDFEIVAANLLDHDPRRVVCHERRMSCVRRATVREMKEGPSSSVIRCRSQATASCCGQKAVVVSVAETPGQDLGRHGQRRAQANRCRSVESGLGDVRTGG